MHISTDYVFDGKKREPYLETDITNPITAYGKTKLAGEYEIFNTDVKAIVIRTSWLYSNFGHNFVNSILRKGEKETSIDVVDDQIGTPNNAKDLAKAIIKIINHKKLYTAAESRELFHYNSIGSVSWYTFAKSIISNSNLDCFINPIKSKSLNLMAKRPKYSVLSNKKITKMFDLIIPHWEESLKDALKTNPILR
jgi:dTDP-4-dehydrorhamnose reductase